MHIIRSLLSELRCLDNRTEKMSCITWRQELNTELLVQGWRNFMTKMAAKFEEIFSLAHENSEEQNQAFDPPITIVHYSSIIINIHYNYNSIINSWYNNYISNTGLLDERNKEENVGVTGGVTVFCLKIRR